MKHEFKKGDGVILSSMKEAREIADLIVANGYKYFQPENISGLNIIFTKNNRFCDINYTQNITNPIPKEEFIRLITGESKYTKEYCKQNKVVIHIKTYEDYIKVTKIFSVKIIFFSEKHFNKLNTDTSYKDKICIRVNEKDEAWCDSDYYERNHYEIIEVSDINLENKNTMSKERKLTRENFKRIYTVACEGWKTRLADRFKDFSIKDEIIVEEGYYQEMRKACTADQHKLFDEIFGKDDNLITGADLKMGEAMLVTEGEYINCIILRSKDGIFLNNTKRCSIGSFSSNVFKESKGKKVKLNISYDIIE